MQNVIADVIASVIVAALSFILIIFGKLFPTTINKLTLRLLDRALRVDGYKPDSLREDFRTKVIERVQQASPGMHPRQGNTITEFENQLACEDELVEHFRKAKTIKILTIRGEKYFLGQRSLFHNLCFLKQAKDFTTKVLVLSPDALHITEEVADQLGQSSAKEIRVKMQLVFEHLKTMERTLKNFEVRHYDETPIFKILLFDDVIFVSAFIQAKSDYNVKMLQIRKGGNPLFSSFEKYFDDLWQRSNSQTF